MLVGGGSYTSSEKQLVHSVTRAKCTRQLRHFWIGIFVYRELMSRQFNRFILKNEELEFIKKVSGVYHMFRANCAI